MALVDEYRKQYKWRSWQTVYSLLPQKKGQTILDLGCAFGDQSRDFATLGFKVIAVDGSQELIDEARKLETNNITYHQIDIKDLSSLPLPQVDGIWLSFTAAYFPNLDEQLKKWCQYLKPSGWIAMVEADDIFAHAPMDERAKNIINQYYDKALLAGTYDFKMGRKLKSFAELAGLEIELAQTLPDNEFCFKGPAPSAILDAWKARLNRMKGLQEFCGENFSQFRMRLMACLVDEGHRSLANVHFVVARQPSLKVV